MSSAKWRLFRFGLNVLTVVALVASLESLLRYQDMLFSSFTQANDLLSKYHSVYKKGYFLT